MFISRKKDTMFISKILIRSFMIILYIVEKNIVFTSFEYRRNIKTSYQRRLL